MSIWKNYKNKLLAAASVYLSISMAMIQQVPAAVLVQEGMKLQEQEAERWDGKRNRQEQEAALWDGVGTGDGQEGHLLAKQAAILPAPDEAKVEKTAYNSVTLSWAGVEGAEKYQVEYTSDGSKFTVAGTVAADAASFKCKNLKTGTAYQFRICAIDSSGKAGNYITVEATPSLQKTKFISVTSPQLSSVELVWKKVSGAASYQVYRKSSGQDAYKLITSTGATSYTDKAVTAGEAYSYRVCAARTVGGKTVKAKLSAAADISLAVPPMQIDSCEAVGPNSVKLSWQQQEQATGYYIYRSVKEDGTYRKIKTVTDNSVLTYTDTKIVPGKKFYYKICTYVQAADKAVTLGEQSEAVSCQSLADVPVFLSVNANLKNRSLALEWEKAEGASGYRIYRSGYPDKGFAKITDREGGTFVGYEDRAVIPGNTYYYRIKALYTSGSYKGLSPASNVIEGHVAPSAPIGLTVEQNGTDSLCVTWQESGGAESYHLYRAEAGDGEYECISQGMAGNSFIDTGLEDGQAYFYKVSAVGAAGEGTKCRPVSFTVGGVALNTRTLKVCVGDSRQLEISTFRQGKAVWKSDAPEVAEVNSEGIVTGISYGTANITATVAGKSASAVVSVTPGSKNGIDVSRWQEDVDWQRVKNSGVDFAFLRISNHYLEDYTFETKYANASSVGIPLGVYCYSRAATVEEAKEEARIVLEILNGRELEYPIAFDLEDAIHKSKTMSKETLHQMILAFKQEVEEAGYRFVLYSYVTFLNSNLDKTKLEGIDLWVARYRKFSLGTGYTGTGNQKFWQYNSGQYAGSNSQMDGITDEAGALVAVDMNIEY